MTSSLFGTLTLQQLCEQAWSQVQEQVREMLKRNIEGLLEAQRDQQLAEHRRCGQKVYRWGYTVRKCWQTLWGAISAVRVPRLRGRAEIALLERYQRHALDEVLFALTVGGLSQRKVVRWVRQFLGGTLSPATIHAVLSAAREQIEQRRTAPIPPGRYRALVVDAVHLRYRRRAGRGPRAGVLLVAVGVRDGGAFDVLDWWAAAEETTDDYEQLLTRLWQRGLERVELVVSDGCEAITSAQGIVYPAARHQLCLAHWFRNLEDLTPELTRAQRHKLRREFWWIWDADDERQARDWARRFCQHWRWWAPAMVEKFGSELDRVLAFFAFPTAWRHRLRTTNLGEGFFKHLRRYLSRFPGCLDAAHSEHILGCFVVAAEQTHC